MKSKKNVLTLTGVVYLFLTLCSMTVTAQTLKDINGKTYKTCQVGMQVWAAENLSVDKFRNGDPLPQVKSDSAWALAMKSGKPAWCYYGNDTSNGRKFGKLYNFFALTDPRGLAPKGWHAPTIYEWSKLVQNLGGVDVAGIKLKSVTDWKQSIPGTNKSGFTAIPGGLRNSNGAFKDVNSKGQWWTSQGDVGSGEERWSMFLNSYAVQVGYFKMDKGAGLSVRCIKD